MKKKLRSHQNTRRRGGVGQIPSYFLAITCVAGTIARDSAKGCSKSAMGDCGSLIHEAEHYLFSLQSIPTFMDRAYIPAVSKEMAFPRLFCERIADEVTRHVRH